MILLNQKQCPVQFGQIIGDYVQSINSSLYIGQLAINLTKESEYASQMFTKLFHSKALNGDMSGDLDTTSALSQLDQCILRQYCLNYIIPEPNPDFHYLDRVQLYKYKVCQSDDKHLAADILESIDLKNDVQAKPGATFSQLFESTDPAAVQALSQSIEIALQQYDAEVTVQSQFLRYGTNFQ